MSRTAEQILAMRETTQPATTRRELVKVITDTKPFGDESRTDLLGLAQLAAAAIVDAEAELATMREDNASAATMILDLVRENERLKLAPAPTVNPRWAEDNQLLTELEKAGQDLADARLKLTTARRDALQEALTLAQISARINASWLGRPNPVATSIAAAIHLVASRPMTTPKEAPHD